MKDMVEPDSHRLSDLPILFHSLLGEFAKLRKATISFVMPVCPSAWNNLAVTGRIFVKFDIWVFF
jgi:hypothetical protein